MDIDFDFRVFNCIVNYYTQGKYYYFSVQPTHAYADQRTKFRVNNIWLTTERTVIVVAFFIEYVQM